MLFKSNNIFSTEKIGLVSELNVTFQRIFHVKIKLSQLCAQYLFFCSIRICLDSVFVKISEIRSSPTTTGDEEAETEIS